MAATPCAHFESNRAPEPAIAVSFAPARVSFCYAYYSYAYQAMLEVRASGE
jgi:hypothetical protein